MIEESELSDIVKDVCKQFGFEEATAEYADYRDLKIRWERTVKMIRFSIPDYLRDAPVDVIRSLLSTILRRIDGEEVTNYDEKAVKWPSSPEFASDNQEMYILRSGVFEEDVPHEKDLDVAYRRLIDLELIEEIENVKILWGKKVGNLGARTSSLMRVIMMSPLLDKEDVPDCVIDYVLYHNLNLIKIGLTKLMTERMIEIAGMDERYPEQKNAEEWLEMRGMEI